MKREFHQFPYPFFDTTSLSGRNCHVLTMKHINTKNKKIPLSETAKLGMIAALRARGVAV